MPGGGEEGRAKILLNLLKRKSLIANIKSKRRQRTFVSPSNFFYFYFLKKVL
jgi:hypothetical protein